jgi:hypothetical protein
MVPRPLPATPLVVCHRHLDVAPDATRCALQILYRGAQAVARCAAQVFDRCAQAVARGAARFVSEVLDRGA